MNVDIYYINIEIICYFINFGFSILQAHYFWSFYNSAFAFKSLSFDGD